MTYIEFFDKNSTENICACIARKPERVIFIGRDRKKMENAILRYNEILSKRGLKTELISKGISPNDLGRIVSMLEELTSKYENCVFDLTGGDELYLVASGIVFNKYPERKIELVRFNFHTGTVNDCDGNGEPEFKNMPTLSIEENVIAYGGRVIWGDDKFGMTHRWKITPELLSDIDIMWDICKKNAKKWNSLINMLAAAGRISRSENSLEQSANVTMLSSATESLITKKTFDLETVEALYDSGLLKSYEFNGANFRVSYKNSDVKRCLTKAGQVLEMKIYKSALEAKDEFGRPIYNDVLTGVCIDWDGESNKIDTENEIDVMMMHGLVPVFISCKNGLVDMDELYKLATVAERFGGKYSRKVLIASSLDLDTSFGRTLRTRAEDMGIDLIADNIIKMSNEELSRRIGNFWR